MHKKNFIDLDVNKAFEEKSVDAIIQIEKLIEKDIEKKHSELRCMVGDRYKDILAASDAIKFMKTFSKGIVMDIDQIINTSKALTNSNSHSLQSEKASGSGRKNGEYALIIQLRIAILLNEKVWTALDQGNPFIAAQNYFFAQHIHMGLDLTGNDYLYRIPLFQHLKTSLVDLRKKIYQKVLENLECMEITADEANKNLNALMLLENQMEIGILEKFIEHRKTTLNVVMNSDHSNAKLLVISMIRCLVTTISLIHECFISKDKNTEISSTEQFQDDRRHSIKESIFTFDLPISPLNSYIPNTVKDYRPNSSSLNVDEDNVKHQVNSWLIFTKNCIEAGLQTPLLLVTNLKTLHLIREEYFKMGLPENWTKICADLGLPDNFHLWCYFFQKVFTIRAKKLVSDIIKNNFIAIKSDIIKTLESAAKEKNIGFDQKYVWLEEHSDITKDDNNHKGLTMKTKGFSPLVVKLCSKLNERYLDLLKDICPYLYGSDFKESFNEKLLMSNFKPDYKLSDSEDLEDYLRNECVISSLNISKIVKEVVNSETGPLQITKSIFCARFLEAICKLCANLKTCCELNSASNNWTKVCDNFLETRNLLWMNWLSSCVEKTNATSQQLINANPKSFIKDLYRWDEIEIQEKAEEKVFKSRIKVPLKSSDPLTQILLQLNGDLDRILPFTLPNVIHTKFLENNAEVLLNKYQGLVTEKLNQVQALQFLFDVRFFMTLCIPRENVKLVNAAQGICDALRSKIDPFDLDVFYPYLQSNVKKAASQSQNLFGCLVPLTAQLTTSSVATKSKNQEKTPSVLALSTPFSNVWFPLLPITGPSHRAKHFAGADLQEKKIPTEKMQGTSSRQIASSIFGGLASDWFS